MKVTYKNIIFLAEMLRLLMDKMMNKEKSMTNGSVLNNCLLSLEKIIMELHTIDETHKKTN